MVQSTLKILERLGASAGSAAPPAAFVPPNVSLSLLLLFGAAGGVLAGSTGAAVSLFLGRKTLARRLAAVTAAGGALYLAILFGFAAASREHTLPFGGRKYFCEIDCHLAYSVVGVRTGAVTGGARDSLRIVEVETWFDPTTIASFRGNAPLTPNPRRAFLIDGRGRRFDPSPEGTKALRETLAGSVPFTRRLRPGESYRTDLVFGVPEGATGLRLWLGDPTPGIEQFLPGHENSFFHAGVYFDLRTPANPWGNGSRPANGSETGAGLRGRPDRKTNGPDWRRVPVHRLLTAGAGASGEGQIPVVSRSGRGKNRPVRAPLFPNMTPRRWVEYSVAILAGNAVYFLVLFPGLSPSLQHQPFRVDAGLLLDFLCCIAVYGAIRLGTAHARRWWA